MIKSYKTPNPFIPNSMSINDNLELKRALHVSGGLMCFTQFFDIRLWNNMNSYDYIWFLFGVICFFIWFFLTRAFSPPHANPPRDGPRAGSWTPNICAPSTRTHRVRRASPRKGIAEPFWFPQSAVLLTSLMSGSPRLCAMTISLYYMLNCRHVPLHLYFA